MWMSSVSVRAADRLSPTSPSVRVSRSAGERAVRIFVGFSHDVSSQVPAGRELGNSAAVRATVIKPPSSSA
jgi:mevalonate kinase